MNTVTSNQEQVVLEVEGYVRGRQLLDKRLKRVRMGEGTYREAKTKDVDVALTWLMDKGYELDRAVGPGQSFGTATVRYIYRKPAEDNSKETSRDQDTIH